MKKFIKSSFGQKCLSWLGFLTIRFIYKTCSWKIINKEIFSQLSDRPLLICFWHQRLLMMPNFSFFFDATPGKAPYMLLSSHTDGQLIGKIIQLFKLRIIEGSSKRGGDQAALAIIKALRRGNTIGITPDGPKGPNRQASLGVAKLAHLTNALVVPVSYSVKKHKRLKSWDQFILPFPFSKGIFYASQPIDSANFETAEDLLISIQQELDKATDYSDLLSKQ